MPSISSVRATPVKSLSGYLYLGVNLIVKQRTIYRDRAHSSTMLLTYASNMRNSAMRT